jgi:hypothetical protein
VLSKWHPEGHLWAVLPEGPNGNKKILATYWSEDFPVLTNERNHLVRIFSEGFVRCLVATENFFSYSKQVVSISYTMEARTLSASL